MPVFISTPTYGLHIKNNFKILFFEIVFEGSVVSCRNRIMVKK